ncbi:hypothetical protein B0H10DRAFT_1980595, partial [Mycena sp. CBHHK59/15]
MFLTTKMCMCGGRWERARLGCGFHQCERLCHTEEEGCGACALACGKLRGSCGAFSFSPSCLKT